MISQACKGELIHRRGARAAAPPRVYGRAGAQGSRARRNLEQAGLRRGSAIEQQRKATPTRRSGGNGAVSRGQSIAAEAGISAFKVTQRSGGEKEFVVEPLTSERLPDGELGRMAGLGQQSVGRNSARSREVCSGGPIVGRCSCGCGQAYRSPWNSIRALAAAARRRRFQNFVEVADFTGWRWVFPLADQCLWMWSAGY